MAAKNTKKSTSAPSKSEPAPRHPRGRVVGQHGSKEALAKALAPSLAKPDQDSEAIAAQLRTASNSQLLRLKRVVDTVAAKYGDRKTLIAKIGSARNKAKDADFLAKLNTLSLPNLLDLARSVPASR